jgi:two-component system, OmpR family, response regulator MprA
MSADLVVVGASRVLVVDDHPPLRDSLRRLLRCEGYDVTLAADGVEALRILDGDDPDLVVLDVMLPGLGGLDVTRTLRLRGRRTPILLLTARDLVGDRVAGLDAGADDYLVKPFALEELLARVRALLRRSPPGAGRSPVTVGDLTFDPVARAATRSGRPLQLTRTEAAILELLIAAPERVVGRGIMQERIWGRDIGYGSNALDVHISQLRRKTEADGATRVIETVRGVGFTLRAA